MSVEAQGSAAAQPTATHGVIHDIGYRRYDGPRLGRGYAVRSLYSHGVRTAFGLGRSAKAKVFPWIVVGLLFVIAAVLTAVRAQTGEIVMSYWEFPSDFSVFIILFCAVVAPELVSRDLRGGVLPLYFSRPLTRWDYALAKLGALVSAVFLLVAGPLLLMFLGAAFTHDSMGGVWRELVDLGGGLVASAAFAVAFGALSLLVASWAGRRAVAAAMIVAVFLITTPVYGVLIGIAYSGSTDGELTGGAERLALLAGLVSPMTLVGGVVQWLFGAGRPYGPLYGLVAAALTLVSVGLLLLRYRKVAR
jgi:ABC-2 type transport system permease protein